MANGMKMADNEKKDVEMKSDDVRTETPVKKINDIEYILKDIGGSFGKFQLYNYVLISVPLFMTGLFSLTYVFTAMNLDYRYSAILHSNEYSH